MRIVLLAVLAACGLAWAGGPPAPAVHLVRGLNVVFSFSGMHDSPDLLLTLEKIESSGLSFRSASRISATDARQNKADYGAVDVEASEDLKSAHHIFTRFFADEDEHAGGTVLMASAEVFGELLSRGSTAIDVVDIPSEKGGVFTPGVTYKRRNFRGTLQRVGIETQRVILNGTAVQLPVLHAHGTLTARELSRDYDFWWLNDPANRLMLHFKSEDYLEFRVTRIDEPEPDEGDAKAGPVEAALSGNGSGGLHGAPEGEGSGDLGKFKRKPLGMDKDHEGGEPKLACHAVVNGVYFATGSAELLSASRPALDKMARLLKKHADWKITVEGHTDNVGDDEANLTLSRNRALSVQSELIHSYGIDSGRVRTAGFGRKRPVDSNDTVDGRAHNRRVEVARAC